MKKLITTTTLAAIGAIATQAEPQTGLTRTQTSKPWSISATLRGFYDDNITTAPDSIRVTTSETDATKLSNPVPFYAIQDINGEIHYTFTPPDPHNPKTALAGHIADAQNLNKQSSYGIEISPSIAYNYLAEQTHVGLGYTFGLRWYENRNPDSTDESHQLYAKIKHDVSPTFSINIADTFRIAQEPQVNGGTAFRADGSSFNQVSRSEQDYLLNDASIHVTKALSSTYSIYTGYANRVMNYENEGFSRLLDRVEHTPILHLRAQINPTTIGLIGYQFKAVDYTADKDLDTITSSLRINDQGVQEEVSRYVTVKSDFRNSKSHYIYAGIDHAFTPTLQGSVRAGAQIVHYPNADAQPLNQDGVTNPYADANLTYGYAENSALQIGVKHERQRNDLAVIADPTNPILDQEQIAVYGSINHQLTAKIRTSLVGHYINGKYEGGGANVDGNRDKYWALGVNVDYMINQFLAAEAGYNFDDLESEFGVGASYNNRSYERNRFYIGLRASY